MPHSRDRAMTGPSLLSRLCLLVAMALAGLLLPTAASAQLSLGQPNHIAHSLSAEAAAPRPGTSVDVALSLTPDAGWHGYWINGGDAGFGLRVEWTLPPGVSIGEFAYPVPQTLVISGLMNHVYEAPYALIAPLTVAANVAPGTRLPIRGEATWLACTREVCVPETAMVTVELVAGDGTITPASRTQFDGWRAALPQPLGSAATYQADGDTIRVSIPYPASTAISRPHLFVVDQRINAPAAPQEFSRMGDRLVITTRAGSDAGGRRPVTALLSIGNNRGLMLSATPGNVPPGGAPIAESDAAAPAAAADMTASLFLTALVGAIIGGLILNIMPCVFPILSLKALAVAKSGGNPREVRAEGLAYTAGAVLVCLALGVVLLLLRAGGESVGWAFQLQNPASVVLLIVLMAAVTANLAGLFELAQVGFGQRLASAGGAKGAFATGALAAFIATPCSGPFLGAALGATLVLPPWAALPIFAGLGFGLALPFLLLAFIPALQRRLPKPGAWMDRLRRWLALPMLLTVVALVWLLGRQVGATGWLVGAGVALAVIALGWWAGRTQAKGHNASLAFLAMAALIVPASLLLPAPQARGDAVASESMLGAQTWSAARLAAIRAEGRPAFVYFTADWCLSCKANEAAAIETQAVADAFRRRHVAVLVADWTNADPVITRELATHGRNSVPLYLFYPAGGGDPVILPQILTPGLLAEAANNAAN